MCRKRYAPTRNVLTRTTWSHADENDPDPSAKLAKDAAAGRHRAERARAKASPSRDQRRLTASLWTMAANSLGGPCLPVHLMVRWRSPEHCWTPR
jgi:hypothetical protein